MSEKIMESVEELHEYWDLFNEIVPLKWDPQVFSKIQSVLQKIINRNVIRDPNPFTMPGIKILINDAEKNAMLEALGISLYNKSSRLPNAIDMIKKCKFFSSIMKPYDKSLDRIAFFAPMVCYASQLYYLGRKKECRTIFFILALISYAGAIISSFYSVKTSPGTKYKVIHNYKINFDVMTTVIEKELNKKSDIKSNTIPEILFEKMDVSINNYAEKNKFMVTFPITDKNLNTIIRAGIISRISAMVNDIAEKYYALLNAAKEGKEGAVIYKYSQTSIENEEGEVSDVDYRSNSQIIEQVVLNAMNQLVRPDPAIAEKAVNTNFGLVISNPEEQVKINKKVKMTKKIEGIIAHIIDKYYKELPKLLRAILQVYIFDWKREKSAPLRLDDPGFLKRATKAFNNNRLNKNVMIIKNMMNLFLNGSEDENVKDEANGSVYYINSEKSQRNNIKKYVYNYFCIILFNELKYV